MNFKGWIGRGASARGRAAVLVLAGAIPAVAGAQQRTSAPTSLVFDGVTVVDVEQGKLLPAQRVVIKGSHIAAVDQAEAVTLPSGARVVDARGKYMIPGMWDMHAHLFNVDMHEVLYKAYIASGVTGIREMGQRGSGNDVQVFWKWQREILAGRSVGPRNIGPSVNIGDGEWVAGTPQEARYLIDGIKRDGNIFVKLRTDFNSDAANLSVAEQRVLFFSLMREARRLGIPVVGHLPQPVTNVEAADSGLRSIEHTGLAHTQCWPGDHAAPLPDSATFDKICTPVVQAYLRNDTWATPTLSVEEGFVADSKNFIPNSREFWRRMRRMGFRNFLAGSDYDAMLVMERGGGGKEIMLMAEALTPLEALQAGTLNPAKFIHGTDSLGTVAAGKLADLVLLDGDPLADIANLLKLWGVVANGHYYDSAALNGLKTDVRAACAAKQGCEQWLKEWLENGARAAKLSK